MARALFVVRPEDLRNEVRCRMLEVYDVVVCDPAVKAEDVRKYCKKGARVLGYLDVAKVPWQGPNNPIWTEIRDRLVAEEYDTTGGVDPGDGKSLFMPTFALVERMRMMFQDLYMTRQGFDGVYLDDCWGGVPDRIDSPVFFARWPFFRDYLLSTLANWGIPHWVNCGTIFDLGEAEEMGMLRGACIEKPNVTEFAWMLNNDLPENIAWYSAGVPGSNVLGGDNWT